MAIALMNKLMFSRLILAVLFWIAALNSSSFAADSIESWIGDVQAVEAEGRGNVAASGAWQKLANVSADQLPRILLALNSANELSANWLRAAVDVVVDRTLAEGAELPLPEIGAVLLDTQHAPRARSLAYEILQKAVPGTAEAMIPGLLSDPNPWLRRLAVAELIGQADKALKANHRESAGLLYRQALGFARAVDQVQHVSDSLEGLGQSVDLPTHFGFLQHWLVVGPFDNVDRNGFATPYPPEKELDFQAEYEGNRGFVAWTPHTSQHPYGMVDINQVCGSLKSVTAYAYTEFHADQARPAEIRLGCKNAWKVWFNGEFLFGRDEYHRGMMIDQYILPVNLRAGRNQILVKICQNEEIEEWTKEWEFQMRVCDPTGSAILSTQRPPALPATNSTKLSAKP